MRKKQKSKERSQIKLAVYALVFLVLLILFAKLFLFLGSLSKPFNPEGEASSKVKIWDGQTIINLAVYSDQLYILSLNPAEKKALLVKIPDDLYLNLPLGFGSYPARSIYSLGQAEKPPIGANLIQTTLIYSFALPIDGYLIYQKQTIPFETLVEKMRGNPLTALLSLFNNKTNLSSLEIYRMMLALQSIRSDKLKILDLAKSQITKSILLPDTSRALGVDQIKLDQFLLSNFEDERLVEESKTIGIYNATTHPQLAEGASRLITNLGGRVIFISNAETNLARSEVLGDKSYTFDKLYSFFTTSCISPGGLNSVFQGTNCQQPLNKNLETQRADINIYLGEDYYQKFNK